LEENSVIGAEIGIISAVDPDLHSVIL